MFTNAASAAYLSTWIEDTDVAAGAKPPPSSSRPTRRKTTMADVPPPFLQRGDAAGGQDSSRISPVCVSTSSQKLHAGLEKLPLTNGGDGDAVDPATNDEPPAPQPRRSRKKASSFAGRRRGTVDDLPAPSQALFFDALNRKSKSEHGRPPVARPGGQQHRRGSAGPVSPGGRRRSSATAEEVGRRRSSTTAGEAGGDLASSPRNPNPSSAHGPSHGKSHRPPPAPRLQHLTGPMHLRDRSLGDAAAPDDTLHQPLTDPFKTLRVHDFVWLRRTCGKWTYAILAEFCKDGDDDAMRFVVDFKGTTKTLKGKSVEKSLRLVNAVDYRDLNSID